MKYVEMSTATRKEAVTVNAPPDPALACVWRVSSMAGQGWLSRDQATVGNVERGGFEQCGESAE
jgi:hypothetical protein